MEVERRYTASLEVREENGRPTLTGLAVPYGKDSDDMGFVETIAPGAFASNLRSDPDVRALIEHDNSKIIGRTRSGTLHLMEDDAGVHVTITPPNSQTGKDVVESVRRGDLSAMSFGFRATNDRWSTRDGKPLRTINEAEFLDVSIVTFPAYLDTSVAVRSMDAWRKENRTMQTTETKGKVETRPEPNPTVVESQKVPERRSAPIATKSDTDGPVEWRDVRTGKEIRVFSREHKFADVYRGEEPLSLGKAVRAMIVGDWSDAPAEHRALSTTSNPTAGILVPNPLAATVIDKARAMSVLAQAGAKTVGMPSGSLTIARVASDATLEVHSENVAFSGSDISFDAVELNASTIGTVVTMSRELAADAPNAVSIIEDKLARALATKLDYYGLRGSGSAEPTGLVTMSGTNAVAVGGSVDWDNLLDGIKECEIDNYSPNAWISSPTNASVLRQLKVNAEANHYATPPVDVQSLLGLVTTNLADSVIAMGDFSRFIIGLRQSPMIEVSTEAGTAFADHSVKIKITWRGDFNTEDRLAFVMLTGIS